MNNYIMGLYVDEHKEKNAKIKWFRAVRISVAV